MKKTIIFLLSLSVFANSCIRDIEQPKPQPDITPEEEITEEVAYEPIPDPFSTDVAQAVFDSLGVDIKIKPNHKYVRFMPADTAQMRVLTDVLKLPLFEYPLDVDIPEGEEYIDDTFVDGMPVWYYTTVNYDFEFPAEIVCETLKEVYIPEEDLMVEDLEGNMVYVEGLLYEKMGVDTSDSLSTRSGGGGGQRPGGRVTVEDNYAGEAVPVKGIRVKISSGVKIDWINTNSDGYYKADKKFWDKNVRYKLVFINDKRNYVVKHAAIASRVKYDYGKKSKYGCSIHIPANKGVVWEAAAICNAAYDNYEMCDYEGIITPSGSSNLRFWLWSSKEYSSAPMIVGYTTIGTKNQDYRELYNVVNHELSHASHSRQAGSAFWGRYRSYIMNNSFGYGDGTSKDKGVCEVGEMWGHVMGDIEASEKYNPARLRDYYNNSSYYKENEKNYDYFDHTEEGSWIHPDPLWALITRHVLTKKQVFDCLTSDVDTKDKLRAKMVSKYPAKADKINEAFSTDNIAFPPTGKITSDSKFPVIDRWITFTAQNSSYDIEFDSYNVTGGNYEAIRGLKNSTSQIKFKERAVYTITAHYVSSFDDKKYTLQTTVDTRTDVVELTDNDLNTFEGYYYLRSPYNYGIISSKDYRGLTVFYFYRESDPTYESFEGAYNALPSMTSDITNDGNRNFFKVDLDKNPEITQSVQYVNGYGVNTVNQRPYFRDIDIVPSTPCFVFISNNYYRSLPNVDNVENLVDPVNMWCWYWPYYEYFITNKEKVPTSYGDPAKYIDDALRPFDQEYNFID